MSSRAPANGRTPASGNNTGSSNDSRQRQLASPVASTPSSSNDADPYNEAREYANSLSPEMAYYHSFLNKLLNLISNGGEQAVARVISVIRSGATHSEILDAIDQASEGSHSNGDSNSGSQGRSA